MEGGQLVLGQARIGKLVAIARNPIPLGTVGLQRVDGLKDQRHAHLAEHVFVPLEVAPKGIVVIGVPANPGPQLLPGDRLTGGKEGGYQVDKSFQPVHG
jgi:hypothetical protein